MPHLAILDYYTPDVWAFIKNSLTEILFDEGILGNQSYTAWLLKVSKNINYLPCRTLVALLNIHNYLE